MPSTRLGQLKALVSSNWASAAVVLIILGAAIFRVAAYGDPRASIGTMDTQSYMAHARELEEPQSLFRGERLLTTGILYSLWGAQVCDLEYVSIPAIGKEMQPGPQDCFAGLALTQVALSLVGWSVLIASVTTILEHAFAKIAAAACLSVFAFTPRLADWDRILSSESLSLSLFALWLGLSILSLKVCSAVKNAQASRRRGALLIAGSVGVGIAWVLVRDAHVYTAMLMFTLLLLCGIVVRPRQRLIIAMAAGALACCILILAASQASDRWKIPLTNAYGTYILPFPERVRVMQRLGMPEAGTGAYEVWFAKGAPTAYAYFLATHPGFVLGTLVEHASALFGENSQPYFKMLDRPMRDLAFTVGDLVHTKSTSILLVNLVLTTSLLISAARRRQTPAWPMAILLAGLFAAALAGLVLTFFADSVGIERHVMLSVMLLRLVVWISLALIIDLAMGTGRLLATAA